MQTITFDKSLAMFVQGCTRISQEHSAKHYPKCPLPLFKVTRGKKYARIVRNDSAGYGVDSVFSHRFSQSRMASPVLPTPVSPQRTTLAFVYWGSRTETRAASSTGGSSQIRTVRSLLADTIRRPSGVTATLPTYSVCPSRVCTQCPDFKSQTRTVVESGTRASD